MLLGLCRDVDASRKREPTANNDEIKGHIFSDSLRHNVIVFVYESGIGHELSGGLNVRSR